LSVNQESDLISKTPLGAYKSISVPEVWIYEEGLLTIHQLVDDKYIKSETSLAFPNQPISTLLPQLIEEAFTVGTSQMLRNLRKQLAQT
jgi:hypothetical protein